MRWIKGLFVAGAVCVLLLVGSCQALGWHDRETRRDTLALVAKELPVGASMGDMQAFMERHMARYALDDRFQHVYSGFLPQTELDKDLFDRTVGVELRFDEAQRFKGAEVRVSYTFL